MNMKDAYVAAKSVDYKTLCRYRDDCRDFLRQNRDFMDAYEFIMGRFDAFYKGMGESLEESHKHAREEEAAIVTYAYANKLDPAEVMYDTAKQNGYGE